MKILIIRFSSLGDIALAALLVRRIREAYPDSAIDFLTGAPYLQLLEAMPWLDERLSADEAVSGRYDYVIDLQNNIRSRRLVGKLDAGRVIRYHRPRMNRFLRIHVPALRIRLATPLHIARQYLQSAARLGVTDDGGRAILVSPSDGIGSAKKMFVENGLGGENLLLVAVGGRHKTKIWPTEKWAEFLKLAQSEGFDEIGIIGSKDDTLTALYFREKHLRVTNFCGKTDLATLIGLISSAKLLVCGDSGPMHIAAGVGTPVVAIFGPTVREFGFAPFTDNARIVEIPNLECRPCHPHGPAKCPLKHFRCMLEIMPETVLHKALELAKPSAGF